MEAKETYRLIEVYRDNKHKAIGYKIKSEYNNKYHKVSHSELKKEMKDKHIAVNGLKIDKAGRLIIDTGTAAQNVDSTEVISKNEDIGIDIYSGDKLINRLSEAKALPNERDCVKDAVKYCSDKVKHINRVNGTLLMIHGLRRTGKTICMLHTILNLMKQGVELGRIVYLEVTKQIEYETLFEIVYNMDKDYIFIDEITFVTNFVTRAQTLVNAMPTKVLVITGTESFALQLSRSRALYMRTVMIRTNLMTLREFERVFGKRVPKSLKEKYDAMKLFIKSSGTTCIGAYEDEVKLSMELNVALIENIANTIRRNDIEEYNVLKKLDKLQLELIIYAYLASVMCVKSEAELRNIVAKQKDDVDALMVKVSGVSDDEIKANMKGVKANQKTLVWRALLAMDVISTITNCSKAGSSRGDGYFECCCNIPALYYSILQAVNNGKLSGVELGNVTENIVVQQCYVQLRNEYFVEYLRQRNKDGKTIEIDIVISKEAEMLLFDEEDKNTNVNTVSLIEVKHSNKVNTSHWCNFCDDIVLDMYGYEANKIVVYYGDNQERQYTVNGVQQTVRYINIHDFLMDIKKWIE